MTSGRCVMVVRHPETEANVAVRYVGRTDSPLTARGLRQTEWLSSLVASWGADVVYSSPLARALQTARAITPPGVPVRVLDDLVEIDFGDAEGLTYEEIARAGLELDYTGKGPIVSGGETGEAFGARVSSAADRIGTGPDRAVVVTHGGVARRLLVGWLGLPIEASWSFGFPNAAVAVVRLCPDAAVLESLTPPAEMSEDRD